MHALDGNSNRVICSTMDLDGMRQTQIDWIVDDVAGTKYYTSNSAARANKHPLSVIEIILVVQRDRWPCQQTGFVAAAATVA